MHYVCVHWYDLFLFVQVKGVLDALPVIGPPQPIKSQYPLSMEQVGQVGSDSPCQHKFVVTTQVNTHSVALLSQLNTHSVALLSQLNTHSVALLSQLNTQCSFVVITQLNTHSVALLSQLNTQCSFVVTTQHTV